MQTIVVIGADAAGMSSAHQALRAAKRTGRDVRVIAVDRGDHTSYSACGIPYWIAGDVDGGDALVARTAEAHREAGIDLRMRTEATAVDLDDRTVTLRDVDTGAEEAVTYDDLVLATGATPILPDWARCEDGSPVAGAGPVKTLDDGQAWLDRLEADPGDVLIVGGGFIGLEMAEAVLARGRGCTVLTRGGFMDVLDTDMACRVRDVLVAAGVEIREDAEVTSLDVTDHRVCGACTDQETVPANLVVIAIGVSPSTDLVTGQVGLGAAGGLLPDAHGLVDADRGLWAAGDCCEIEHRVSGRRAFIALGTHANKHGRALGDHLVDPESPLSFGGALGTAITRFAAEEHHVEVSLTGLTERTATRDGLDVVALTTEGTMASGYMPESDPVAIRVVAERGSRRLLGVQIVGGHGAGKRIDAAAAVLWHGGTVDDLAWMDLSYAPPFATAWEILQVAARRVAERL